MPIGGALKLKGGDKVTKDGIKTKKAIKKEKEARKRKKAMLEKEQSQEGLIDPGTGEKKIDPSSIDPVTGNKVDVSSFGQTNAEIFTNLLLSSENKIEKEEG